MGNWHRRKRVWMARDHIYCAFWELKELPNIQSTEGGSRRELAEAMNKCPLLIWERSKGRRRFISRPFIFLVVALDVAIAELTSLLPRQTTRSASPDCCRLFCYSAAFLIAQQRQHPNLQEQQLMDPTPNDVNHA